MLESPSGLTRGGDEVSGTRGGDGESWSRGGDEVSGSKGGDGESWCGDEVSGGIWEEDGLVVGAVGDEAARYKDTATLHMLHRIIPTAITVPHITYLASGFLGELLPIG